MPDIEEPKRPRGETEPDDQGSPAPYRRPLLRSHGAVSRLTAKSGDTDSGKTLNDISDVHAKENIVAVVWR